MECTAVWIGHQKNILSQIFVILSLDFTILSQIIMNIRNNIANFLDNIMIFHNNIEKICDNIDIRNNILFLMAYLSFRRECNLQLQLCIIAILLRHCKHIESNIVLRTTCISPFVVTSILRGVEVHFS